MVKSRSTRFEVLKQFFWVKAPKELELSGKS
jgi:hypothetical protein